VPMTEIIRAVDNIKEVSCLQLNLFKCVGQFLANVNSRSCSLYSIARLSVCLSSVTFVRPTQAIEIFGNISVALGTLAIH